MSKLLTLLISSPKIIFIIDGIGALSTAMLLLFFEFGQIFEFGMPEKVMISLSIIALIYSVYSFSCFLFIKRNCLLFLRMIACANFFYCLLTFGLLYTYFENLTNLAVLYFSIEIVIILILVKLELHIADSVKFDH